LHENNCRCNRESHTLMSELDIRFCTLHVDCWCKLMRMLINSYEITLSRLFGLIAHFIVGRIWQ
jgi:hypothetical protein